MRKLAKLLGHYAEMFCYSCAIAIVATVVVYVYTTNAAITFAFGVSAFWFNMQGYLWALLAAGVIRVRWPWQKQIY